MAKQAPIRYWIAILITQGLGAFAAYAGAVYFWSTSLLSVVVFLAIMVLPIAFYAAMGSFVLDPTKTSDALVKKDSPAVTRRLWLATSPIAASALVYCALLLTFQAESTRIALVETSSSQGYYQVAERGLFDDAAAVRMAACKTIGAHSPETSTPALAYALQYDDALADCAMEFVGAGANDIMIDLQSGRWELELVEMKNNEQAERACLLARRLFHADRIGMASAIPRLLTCATDSESDAARECCAQSLVAAMGDAPGVAALMPAPAAFAASSFVDRLPVYMAASQVAPTNSLEVSMGMSGPPMRSWTIRTACAAIVQTPDIRDGMVNSLADATATPECIGPDVNALSLVAWENACATLTPEVPDVDVAFVVCDAARKNLLVDTNLSAQRMIRRALHAAEAPERQSQLTQAILDYVATKAKDADIPGANMPEPKSDARHTIDLFRSGELTADMFQSGDMKDVSFFLNRRKKPQNQTARQQD